ncbi:TPA: creatininase family protein [Candidatus Poribacteria bacterium]|nr:creatininase family protein [Candidatus Poribacteria bacterium]
MSDRPYILAEITWKTAKDNDYEVALLPWGATEAHNYHLPYSTDVIQCDYIAAESARLAWEKKSKVIVLPTVPFGVNTGQLDIKLDINMNPSTQAAVLRDIVDSLSQQGISKMVVMNGHGGNNFKQMIREIQPDYSHMLISTLSWYQVIDTDEFFNEPGDHAGEMETSNMLFITPHLVQSLSEAGDGVENRFKLEGLRQGWVWAQREWSKATADTGIGNPAKSKAEKGEVYLRVLTEKIAGFLIELAACNLDDLYG